MRMYVVVGIFERHNITRLKFNIKLARFASQKYEYDICPSTNSELII